ncbi:hypothetical protein JCM11251_006265, partial [Rhodosporidiobolus azoricus]
RRERDPGVDDFEGKCLQHASLRSTWDVLTLPNLQAKHAAGEHRFGVDGEAGKVVDMKEYGLYESAAVKIQTLKTAIESACLLLRVDDIVSAKRPQGEGGPGVQTMGAGEHDGPEGQ